MSGKPDFNLLITLDVLLTEGSVARAAKRLALSPSAMSRALARLRNTMGDPLLVRAGRKLVPTPRAEKIREEVRQLVEKAKVVLKPAEQLQLKQLSRTFTVRTNDGFVENFGARLIARVHAEAPEVKIRFEQKPNKDAEKLREGGVDFEVGVIDQTTSPELRRQVLYVDRFVGVVRKNHSLSRARITAAGYAAGKHVSTSRHAVGKGLIDQALQTIGLEREIVTIIPGFSAALAIVRDTDFIATVPEKHTQRLRAGMFSFSLPFRTPKVTVSLLWHPRSEADAAHRWFRETICTVCAKT